MNQEVSRTIREYFKTQPVEKAWFFGSFSRGEERADCDVDILITLIPGTRMGLKFFAMNIELEKLLNRPWVREPSPDPPSHVLIVEPLAKSFVCSSTSHCLHLCDEAVETRQQFLVGTAIY